MYGTTLPFGKSDQTAMLTVTAGLRCAPLSAAVRYMAVAIPKPHTIATWNTPTCAPVKTAAHTLPHPKKTNRKVPTNSPVNHFGNEVMGPEDTDYMGFTPQVR